jgi:Holliday junction resolvase RusA-like endonuclease
MSVNKAWQGKRYKTTDYKVYEQELMYRLPKAVEIPEGPLRVIYEFGVSNPLSDWDNPCKPFQDVLQKRYEFDDRRIMEATVKKVIVEKGKEYISFSILPYRQDNVE